MRTVQANQNDTLDLVVYRYLGDQQGLVEQCLELNPKLANQVLLQAGQKVILPTVKVKQPTKQTIQLWS